MDSLHSTVYKGVDSKIRDARGFVIGHINHLNKKAEVEKLKNAGNGILIEGRLHVFARYRHQTNYHLVELGVGVVDYILCNWNPISPQNDGWHISANNDMLAGFAEVAARLLQAYPKWYGKDFHPHEPLQFVSSGKKNPARYLCHRCMQKYLRLKVKELRMAEKNVSEETLKENLREQGGRSERSDWEEAVGLKPLHNGKVYLVNDPTKPSSGRKYDQISVRLGRAFMFNSLFKLHNDMRVSELMQLVRFIYDKFPASMCRTLDLFGQRAYADLFMEYIKTKDCLIKFLLKFEFLIPVEVHRLGNEYDIFQVNHGDPPSLREKRDVYPGGPWRLSVTIPAEFPIREQGDIEKNVTWAPGDAYVGLIGITGTIFGRPVRITSGDGTIHTDVMDKLMMTGSYRYVLKRTREEVELGYSIAGYKVSAGGKASTSGAGASGIDVDLSGVKEQLDKSKIIP